MKETTHGDLYVGLVLRMTQATKRMQFCVLHALGTFIVGLLGLGAISQAAYVLAFGSVLSAIWFALIHVKYDGLLHLMDLHTIIRPQSTGEDWLAYHLAERLREEELAIAEAVIAAEEAVRAAVEAAGSTDAAQRH